MLPRLDGQKHCRLQKAHLRELRRFILAHASLLLKSPGIRDWVYSLREKGRQRPEGGGSNPHGMDSRQRTAMVTAVYLYMASGAEREQGL